MSETKRPFFKRVWFWVAAVFVFFMIVGSLSGGQSTPTNTQSATQEQSKIIDGARILTLTIDDVRQELGTPDDASTMDPTERQLDLGTSTWTNQYTVSGHTVVLDFGVKSREVTGFFIGTDEKDGITRDWKALLTLSNLSEDAQEYSLKPVAALKNPGYYTGVQATE